MCQQRQFPVCLLDLTICRRPFNRQDLVEIGGSAFSNSEDGRLLLDCVLAVLVALVMLVRSRAAIRVGS